MFIIESGDACTTPNGESAHCAPLNSCSVIKSILRRRDPDTVQFLQESQCEYDDEPLVCCGSKNQYDRRPALRASSAEVAPEPNDAIASKEVCGKMESSNRILGGVQTDIDEFPWTVLLQYKNAITGKTSFTCGGSLIGPRYVLTAAHCIIGSNDTLVKVRLGEWNMTSDLDCAVSQGFPDCADPHVDVDIEEVVAHPDFRPTRGRHNDIALVRLKQEVNFTDFIVPICLPSPMDETKVGEKLSAAGWGWTELKHSSEVKMKVRLPKVSRRSCKSMYKEYGYNIIKSQICAGGLGGMDTCAGDSGGPLMNVFADNQLQWYLEGIVSFGKACGMPGWPGVYTKVSRYLNWIYSNVR